MVAFVVLDLFVGISVTALAIAQASQANEWLCLCLRLCLCLWGFISLSQGSRASRAVSLVLHGCS